MYKGLNEFTELFTEYNSHTNLMSKTEIKNLKTKHIPESLTIKYVFEKYFIPKNILDIGSGGGFPILPIAITYPNIECHAVESIKKKILFLEQTAEKLNLNNFHAHARRIENLPAEYKNKFDMVTSRALAELPIILEYSAPYTKIGGLIVAYKSINADEEIQKSKKAIELLGLQYIETIQTIIENNKELTRCLVIIKKIKPTPKQYPRQNNLPVKNPIL